MWQNASKMRKVSLVNGEDAFRLDRLVQAVEHAFVEIAGLVVHPRHDRVCGWIVSLQLVAPIDGFSFEIVPGGCITQQTTNPLQALLARCRAGPSSMPKCFVNRRLAKKYVGSCTELPKPVRTMAAPTPR